MKIIVRESLMEKQKSTMCVKLMPMKEGERENCVLATKRI